VHPVLRALLAEWKVSGFALLFGRHPQPEDPIVPQRADVSAFRGKHTFERLNADQAKIGIRRVPSARHAMRATFLSLLEADGANMAIARRATHAAPSDVVGGYVRVQWADVCNEIAKLRIALGRGKVIPMRRVVTAGDSFGDNPSDELAGAQFSGPIAMGGTGFEPATDGV
jgi:hypothetical protein